MSLPKKRKNKGGGEENLIRATDQFWSDISKMKESVSFVRDSIHNTQSSVHSQSSYTQNPRHNNSQFRYKSLDHDAKSCTLKNRSPVSTRIIKTQPFKNSNTSNTNQTQSFILHSQSSVRISNQFFDSHSSIPQNNNFQHHLSTSTKIQPISSFKTYQNFTKRSSASAPDPSLQMNPKATLPGTSDQEPPTKFMNYIVSTFR